MIVASLIWIGALITSIVAITAFGAAIAGVIAWLVL